MQCSSSQQILATDSEKPFSMGRQSKFPATWHMLRPFSISARS
eukprot:SAG11_NODE_2175_length_3718_cov_3.873169_5_plen_42_part_01